jgi:hypothetical protein
MTISTVLCIHMYCNEYCTSHQCPARCSVVSSSSSGAASLYHCQQIMGRVDPLFLPVQQKEVSHQMIQIH